MKAYVLGIIFLLHGLSIHAQDTIPQIEFTDCDLHKIHIRQDTVSKIDTWDKIFFLNKHNVWQEIPLYEICPVCTIQIRSCVYKNEILTIRAIITFDEVTLRYRYEYDTWKKIPASD